MEYYGNNDYRDYLAHHGILGMKWGKKNGPPYPLSGSAHSASEKKAGWKKSLGGGRNETLYGGETEKKKDSIFTKMKKRKLEKKRKAALEKARKVKAEKEKARKEAAERKARLDAANAKADEIFKMMDTATVRMRTINNFTSELVKGFDNVNSVYKKYKEATGKDIKSKEQTKSQKLAEETLKNIKNKKVSEISIEDLNKYYTVIAKVQNFETVASGKQASNSNNQNKNNQNNQNNQNNNQNVQNSPPPVNQNNQSNQDGGKKKEKKKK